MGVLNRLKVADKILFTINKMSVTLIVMAHSRDRHFCQKILESLKWSPAVGVFGMRQVGKTTLMQRICNELGGVYETFDNQFTLQASEEKSVEFLKRTSLLCIDEAQQGSWIFPTIKQLIGITRKPGQFLLTGSIRFTLKKEIRESLTGRIVLHELLPFTLSEAHQKKPSLFLSSWIKSTERASQQNLRKSFDKFLSELRETTSAQMIRHALVGGLPIPCFSRDDDKRRLWFDSYLETLLTRDLQLVDKSLAQISWRQTYSLLKELAMAQGTDVNSSDLAAKSGMRPAHVKKIIQALEALAVIDFIPPEIRATKSARKLRLEWKDIGLWRHCLRQTQSDLFSDTRAMSLMLSQEWRGQLALMARGNSWHFYRSREGGHVPWIFQMGDVRLVVQYIPLEAPKPYDYRTIKNVVSDNNRSFGVILGSGKMTPTILNERLWAVPVNYIF